MVSPLSLLRFAQQAQQAATKLPRDDAFRTSIKSLEATFVSTLRSLLETLRAPEFTQELFFFSERLDFSDFYVRPAAATPQQLPAA